MQVRTDWLALVQEEVIDPDRRIVDPHHHIFVGSPVFDAYELEDLWADTGSGHRVEQTVFVECHVGYRKEGPAELKPVGETEYVARIAAETARSPGRARISGIVSHADLMLGAGVGRVLEAHLEASELVRGIRHVVAWDATDAVPNMSGAPDEKRYMDPRFREGFAQLAPLGLTFDAYNYHPQTRHLTDLARAFPETTIIFDHFGSPLGLGPYAGRQDEIFPEWARDLSELASCPNVVAKLGGLVMAWCGFGWDERDRPPTSDELVEVQRRYYLHAIEAFGPERCMFESNFPVDKMSVSYAVMWNCFKKLVADFSEDEKDQMFRGTATRIYRLDPIA